MDNFVSDNSISHQMDLICLDDFGDFVELPSPITVAEEKLYVAVTKEVRESEATLLWAIQNSGGMRICILHVHQPAQMIPILGKKFHVSLLKEQEVKAYREIERHLMVKTLDDYLHICGRFGVRAEKLHVEMESVEKGILELICRYGIEKLVMGAAADESYSTNMMGPTSKKAIHVQQHAPASCHIWFICKGHLVHLREGGLPVRTNAENDGLANWRSTSTRSNIKLKDSNQYREAYGQEGSSYFGVSKGITTKYPCMDDAESMSTFSTSPHIEGSSSQRRDVSSLWLDTSCHLTRRSAADLSESSSKKNPSPCPPPRALLEEGLSNEIYERLKQALSRAESSRREALEELARSQKAQNEAVRRAKSLELSDAEEFKKMIELEEELEKVKNDRDKLSEELKNTVEQNSMLESKITNYDQVMKNLEESMVCNVELLQVYEKERDDLRVERDNVLKTAEELLNQSAESFSRTDMPEYFITYTFSDIKEATFDFDPSLQLWEGDYGSIYNGVISNTQVTIKMFNPDGSQGSPEFQQEVEVLSKIRHPNLITLIGVCPEAWSLIYEYLRNGSLEDRLSRKDDTPPLQWKTRIQVATELCSALTFLHSCKPHRIVHGALKLSSVQLDSNFACKISGFGSAHVIPYGESSASASMSSSREYIDPEFLETGEITPKLDVYSFGVILLKLLTGNLDIEILEMQDALNEENLHSLLDSSAGDWPFVQAEQLARLALSCCEANPRDRPDLGSEIWRVLEPMRVSCGGLASYPLGDDKLSQAPSYFICPIFQEVMKDPQVAADGYTYEAEALRGWLESGHDTSPMTNLQLEHCNLVPNHALRSAIQEWLQQN